MNRERLFISLSILAGIVAGLAISEVAARLILGNNFILGLGWYGSERRLYERAFADQTNDDTHYTYDAEGFRGREPHLPWDRTVLFIGDSFTEGSGVSDDGTFSAVAERDLRHRGIRVRCLNAGVHGLGAAQELRLTRELLDGRHIDALVVQLFPRNDLKDNWEDGGFSLENGRLIEHDRRQVPRRIALRDVIVGSRIVRYSVAARVLVRALVPARYFDAPLDDVAYELERRLLVETVATARRHGVPVLFTVVGADPAECAPETDPHPDHEAYRRMREIMQQIDAPSIDLCSVASRPADFGTVNPHYSPLGYARAGHAIAEALVHQGWLGSGSVDSGGRAPTEALPTPEH